jgi:nitroreductase
MTGPHPLKFIKHLARILAARPVAPPAVEGNPLLETILNRRSVRRFAKESLPDAVLEAILESGRLAPSSVNFQTWSFFVFTASTWESRFGRPMPFGASRAVMVMADTHRCRQVLDVFPRRPLVEYTLGVINASLAAMNMTVAAEALGVASVMLTETGRSGYLDAAELKKTLALPAGVIPLLTLALGYRRIGLPPMPPKLPLGQIRFTGTYREADPNIMKDWLAQMVAGYKADHPFSSFDAQLELYRSRIDRAETELGELVYGQEARGPE